MDIKFSLAEYDQLLATEDIKGTLGQIDNAVFVLKLNGDPNNDLPTFYKLRERCMEQIRNIAATYVATGEDQGVAGSA